MRRILAVDDDRHTRIRLKQCGFAANSSDPPNNYRERADTGWTAGESHAALAAFVDPEQGGGNHRHLPSSQKRQTAPIM